MTIYFGCAVWAYKGWAGDFYPAKVQPSELLARYVERLHAVEGNTTFYATPDQDTVARWAEQMPPAFRFLPKLPQTITHRGELTPHIDQALAFLRLLEPLGQRLGPVMLQLPPDYGPAQMPDLDRFLREVAPACPARLSVEVRHVDWWHAAVADPLADLLEQRGALRTLLDTRPIYEGPEPIEQERKKPQVPILPIVHHGTAIIRYIGHPEPARNAPYLQQWAARVDRWLDRGDTVYFFAHCPIEERSPGYARDFHRALQARRPDLSSLPWDMLPPEPQLTLF